jgi:hypothetical protein
MPYMGFSMGDIELKFKMRQEKGVGRKCQGNRVFQYFYPTGLKRLRADFMGLEELHPVVDHDGFVSRHSRQSPHAT